MNYSTKYPLKIHLTPESMVFEMQNWGVHVVHGITFIAMQRHEHPEQILERTLRQMAIELEAGMSKQYPKGPS